MIADDQTSIDRTTIFRFDELILPRRSTWTFQPPRVNGRWFVFFFSRPENVLAILQFRGQLSRVTEIDFIGAPMFGPDIKFQ